MKFFVAIAAFAAVAVAAPAKPEPYPAPCGRSDPSGICTTKPSCAKQGGFYVQRDCTCKQSSIDAWCRRQLTRYSTLQSTTCWTSAAATTSQTRRHRGDGEFGRRSGVRWSRNQRGGHARVSTRRRRGRIFVPVLGHLRGMFLFVAEYDDMS